MARTRNSKEKTPGEYAKEALAEWRKAAGYGAAALSAARARKNGGAGEGENGGRAGKAADTLLGKLGAPGKAASKLGLGSSVVEKVRPNIGRNGDHRPIPVQVAIEVAVPIEEAYELATSVDDYPDFLDRMQSV